MNIFVKIVSTLFAENSKMWGAGIGALLAQAVDPTVLGPIVTDPVIQQATVDLLGAMAGAWFASANRSLVK